MSIVTAHYSCGSLSFLRVAWLSAKVFICSLWVSVNKFERSPESHWGVIILWSGKFEVGKPHPWPFPAQFPGAVIPANRGQSCLFLSPDQHQIGVASWSPKQTETTLSTGSFIRVTVIATKQPLSLSEQEGQSSYPHHQSSLGWLQPEILDSWGCEEINMDGESNAAVYYSTTILAT